MRRQPEIGRSRPARKSFSTRGIRERTKPDIAPRDSTCGRRPNGVEPTARRASDKICGDILI
ncbi:MAG: hypothetical protein DBX55_09015 [Verrucomicrobia bacterium]|nr:MAG: hypothetical protein DBX55_09015 [Verrucomicrobiota bacterium]